MNENNFMRVEDVAKELGISISHSYKVMQQLNKELKAKGYMTIAGRVNRKYFMEKFCYNGTERSDQMAVYKEEKTGTWRVISRLPVGGEKRPIVFQTVAASDTFV